MDDQNENENDEATPTAEDGEIRSSQTGAAQAAESVESGDNSLLDDDEGYVGVSKEYRNAAYDTSKPLVSEDADRAEAEHAAKEHEVLTAVAGEEIGRLGYKVDTPHPTEAKNKSDEALRNRARLDEEARQEVRSGANRPTESDDDDKGATPQESRANPFGR